MLGSIRWRLVLSFAFLTLLTVALVGVLALALVQRYVVQQETEQLTANAEAVARQALPVVRPVLRRRELQQLAETSAFLVNARVRILDGKRQVVADSGADAQTDEFALFFPPLEWQVGTGEPSKPFLFNLPASQQGWLSLRYGLSLSGLPELSRGQVLTLVQMSPGTWGSHVTFHSVTDEDQLRHLSAEREATPRSAKTVSVPIGETDAPVGYVEISNSLDLTREPLKTTRQAFLLAAGGAMLMAVAVGLLVSRGLSAPLRELAEAAGHMSGGDLSTRAVVRSRDEIGQLAGRFNRMAERLEASFAELAAERDALRRFIADASHELRTPITALKNFNDLLRGAAADDPAARAEFLTESQAQVERLEWITRNLLDLSRLDAGLVGLDIASHDAGEVIEAAAAPFRTLAQDKGITLSIEPPAASVKLRCDRAWIELALSNLLDNALKFTPAGGRVEVSAEPKGKAVQLRVRDSGPGIDSEDLPHIFERFYRGRNNHSDGSGLGLAIVRSVAQAHGGQVTVRSRPGAGSLFIIEVPQ
jgi:signal transduction histidine kinase